MTKKIKGRTGCHQAASFKTFENKHNYTNLSSRIKAVIVTLALWGWFPISLADRINKMGGSR